MQNEEIRKFNFSDVEIVISDSKDFLKFAYKNKLLNLQKYLLHHQN